VIFQLILFLVLAHLLIRSTPSFFLISYNSLLLFPILLWNMASMKKRQNQTGGGSCLRRWKNC
jgi:hypothetical protein